MTNPQDNPGTPPQPTPSDSSTSHSPSTTPKPRLRRVKMLARKIVASEVLSKKLKEKLKANQVQDSKSNFDSESYKSTSEGEGTGSSDSEKAQESHSKVISLLFENLETRFVLVGPIKEIELPEVGRSGGKKKSTKEKERDGACGEERGKGKRVVDHLPTTEESGKKSGGSGSGEATEGLVNLSSQRDEPGSSVKETLAALLKKVGASYDPKKRRTSTPKVPSAPKPSKKRKASSPIPTDTSLPKGRDTRSKVKQSEADLQRALAESKKKKMDKGKGMVAESSEAV
ncbi:uncharacterized protein [Nicotiana sylvestris]|uniref:uncharacterized protein n=1 Tax=Nicotiana sylvestris TaxID=4096 RepID=UPI00388CDCEB